MAPPHWIAYAVSHKEAMSLGLSVVDGDGGPLLPAPNCEVNATKGAAVYHAFVVVCEFYSRMYIGA